MPPCFKCCCMNSEGNVLFSFFDRRSIAILTQASVNELKKSSKGLNQISP